MKSIITFDMIKSFLKLSTIAIDFSVLNHSYGNANEP